MYDQIGKVHYLKDRMGALFPVIPDRDGCTNIILNSAPVYMGDKTDDLRRGGVAFANLYFTIEDAEDIAYITDLYKNGKPFGKNFTRGS